ncbi:hypothetical protein [Nitrosomonas sp. sh817]|nr:hypothetical protein [Nitrosomonas sp. sh817]
MQLDPGIEPEILMGRKKVMADVTVIFGYDSGRNRIPKLVFLREIND